MRETATRKLTACARTKMKRCPQCNRVETDDALAFCRADGTALISDSASVDSEPGQDRPNLLVRLLVGRPPTRPFARHADERRDPDPRLSLKRYDDRPRHTTRPLRNPLEDWRGRDERSVSRLQFHIPCDQIFGEPIMFAR
jgi:hypothetical protein